MKSDTKIGITVVLLLVAVVGVLLGKEIMRPKNQVPTDAAVAGTDETLSTADTKDLIAEAKKDVADPAAGMAPPLAADARKDKDLLFDPTSAATGLEPLPGAAPAPAGYVPPAAPVVPATPSEYVVKAGDRGETIAKQVYGRKYFGKQSAWELIAAANPGVNASRLKIGTRLAIPAAPAEAAVVADTGSRIASSEGAGIVPAAGARTYTVKSGDLLSSIARKFYGRQSAWSRIAEANPGVNPNRLKIGTVLTIPEAPAGTGKPARAEPQPQPWKNPGATRLVTSPG